VTSPLVQEIRYALRRLALHPGFTALAVVSVGIGIGASTAMFSVLHAVLLSPLPYTKPERLVLVWSDLRSRRDEQTS
jgi:putative ABC transport system permease protein